MLYIGSLTSITILGKSFLITKVHYIERDTDSLYFAISGDKNEDINQEFKHIISNEKCYNEKVSKWLPCDF
jgi:hypothetical protein